ncbi:inner membrane component of binding-protein-dependent transport system [Nitratireductor indicus C115]|uniref:Inner membrane component of binding-protein-dependent transport system n=1 Tax=Nitratireductor indicus C115 TaxID=1231190 RepID=K2P1M9_9HYPH|nr:inner membrane component of binding-protein-dependent transport system [Nitratireductor indicus C115]
MLLPAAVLLAAFTHFPAVMTFISSTFQTPRGKRPAKFVGMDHYASMLSDPVFVAALKNNAIYALGTVPASIALAMLMAVIVNSAIKGKALLRMSFFLPTVLPMIAVANMWLFFYTPGYGLIDQFLGLFGFHGRNWLGDPETALGSLMVLAVWKEAGFFMIFYLAALQQISPSLGEAAALEGAGRWYFFRRVTFPLLMPTTLFVMINAFINSFRLIDHVIVMTRGGPDNASTLLLYYVYNVAFRYWDTAYASAITVVILIVLALLAFIQFGILDRKVHYK